MIRAVFFDLDDTLVDAMMCHGKANFDSFEKFGLDYKKAKELSITHDSLGRRMIDNLKVRRDALGVDEKELSIKKLAKVREDIFVECVVERAELYPGAFEAVRQAREKCEVVVVVSSGTKKYIKTALEKFYLLKYVDFIVSAEDVERGKPFPDCYERAFKMLPSDLKIKKEECLVVEDSLNGVKAGKAAGLKVLLVPSKYTKGEIDADWTLDSLEEFDLKKFK